MARGLYPIADPLAPGATRDALRSFAAARATQLVVTSRGPCSPGQWRRFADEVIAPVAHEHA
jgi:hypothetical protein